MATLQLKDINKVYPNGVQAVFDFNLDIKDKEFIVFVGPSGCGKSTTLRMIAGLEDISSGELYIDGEYKNDTAPKDRDIAMVFQSYALYPHMTVYDNIAFGLKLRKVPKAIIKEKVQAAAEILGLVPYLDRKPKALSGGQRQRVALGRSIVRDAKVFLMDEPLSNLDAKLRVQMRGELIKLHKQLDTTTIYVTHDQIEAMTMATRIVVMNKGYIMQVGEPKEIYDRPANIFVAGFIGTPPMNFINGRVTEKGVFEAGQYKIKLPQDKFEVVVQNGFIEKPIVLGIRAEDIHDDELVMQAHPDGILDIVVDVAELLGAETNIYTEINGSNVIAKVDARTNVHIGDKIKLGFDLNKLHFFDPETELRLVLDPNKKAKAAK
ncbi:sn-glycerol-3-phosphate import ATP-binding protein UgpC [Acholeplasma oculi]|uniref:MOP-like ABC transporter, substrate-binding/ATP-binding protein n=1 Tax=Acholeplasma oculi TaxID=35623 RepID=A0A061AAF3_9MOLU|nr:sn-glycerol-3-phosphate ABC transporter ATP-binding protein UgpC [Acholeplasma oculi]CDR30813.1 MOP-like ABC transporter, substrate-binding/ATP-binding protein [Acholeplasma oculi]SKC35082.1 carbohydrate ABC transporter ATP-binding protein, CUT1 family [Acholeplasma oculi]SUT89809.1 sn-glycerol-3-phosphate import ATP-binding protein UgpC [Acholeplasma oculi]